jgi:hypothetical protein
MGRTIAVIRRRRYSSRLVFVAPEKARKYVDLDSSNEHKRNGDGTGG